MGSDCLPHSLLTCTTTICRLRNKDEKKVLITDKANVTKELDLPQDVDAAWMKSELKKYVSSGVDYDQYNYVDIHWPIPILKVGVVSHLILYFLCRYSPDDGDRIVVGFTNTYALSAYLKLTTKIVSSNPVHGKVNSSQNYVIQFVSDFRQVGGFLWVLWFPPLIKVTATI